MPRIPIIFPASRRRAASATGSGNAMDFPDASYRVRTGPQDGHAIVCAWCLREAGSRYSARQPPQRGNTAMEVRSRSYGNFSIMLYLGPQFTHDVAQYPPYRPRGLSMSRIQSAQVATSGGIIPERAPSPDGRIENPSGTGPGNGSTCTSSILERGGAFRYSFKKFFESRTGCNDLDLTSQVFYRASDAEFACLRVHVRPEPHTLYDPPDPYPAPGAHPCFPEKIY